MKKSLFMIGSLIMTIVSLISAIYSYNVDETLYGIYFLVLGVVSISVYAIVLGTELKQKLDNKMSIILSIIALIIYAISYSAYMVLFNISIDLNFIGYVSLLVLFYVSMFNYIFIIACSFYHWNFKKLKKNILTFLIISITLIIVSLILSLIFKSLPVALVETIKFIYFTAVISLFMYIITSVFQKIVCPISK